MTYKKQRKEIAKYLRKCYQKGYITSLSGNISQRVDTSKVLISVSQQDKSIIKKSGIGLTNLRGEQLEENMKLSMETPMHLQLYRFNSQVQAIVHAHPPFATAFSISNQKIDTKITDEGHAVLNRINIAEYAPSSTEELAIEVAKAAYDADVILMPNHGVICLGTSLLDAFHKLEILEHTAKLQYIATQLGDFKTLDI